MTEEPRLKLWMVNQYAVGPNQAGGTRHAGLARGLMEHGVDSLIIASPRSYMSGATAADDQEQDGWPRFLWLSAPAYSGNSLGRVLNMFAFALKVVAVPLLMVLRRRLSRPDVIMGSSPSMFSAMAAWMLAKATGARFVLEIRDIYPKTITALGHASRFHPFVVLLGLLEQFLYRRAEFIVSPLQRASEHVERTIGKKKPMRWIPNYVDLSRTPEPGPARAHPQPFSVVYTGQHGVANALDTVLEAAQLLNDNVEFRLYGDGVAKTQLLEKAARLKITNVVFEDPVPKDQVHQVQQAADAVLMIIRDSPLWEDGFSPNKLYDYLASGRPVIFAAKVSHNPVADSSAGITVRPEDPEALAEGIVVLTNTSLEERNEMGRRGRELVARTYDLPVVAKNLAAVLQTLRGTHA